MHVTGNDPENFIDPAPSTLEVCPFPQRMVPRPVTLNRTRAGPEGALTTGGVLDEDRRLDDVERPELRELEDELRLLELGDVLLLELCRDELDDGLLLERLEEREELEEFESRLLEERFLELLVGVGWVSTTSSSTSSVSSSVSSTSTSTTSTTSVLLPT